MVGRGGLAVMEILERLCFSNTLTKDKFLGQVQLAMRRFRAAAKMRGRHAFLSTDHEQGFGGQVRGAAVIKAFRGSYKRQENRTRIPFGDVRCGLGVIRGIRGTIREDSTPVGGLRRGPGDVWLIMENFETAIKW